MSRRASTQPTDGELEILKVLWDIGPTGLGAIVSRLQERRAVAMTTVATMLKTMREKGLVERSDGPKGYAWNALVTEKAAASGLIGKLLNHVFDGSARRLVAHLIEDGQIDAGEREEILKLLRAPQGPKTGGKEA